MKIFVETILPKILSYSEKLDKLSLLIDEPWVVIAERISSKKFIFRKDNSLLISENGSVTLGKWDLLNKANSILLEYNGLLRLYNHGFLDEAVLILQIDGGNDYFVLVNQNRVPDLNLERYLQNKYVNANGSISSKSQTKGSTKSKERIHSDKGDIVIECLSGPNTPSKGDYVTIDGCNAPNGKYKIGSMFYIHVLNGKIDKTSMF